MPQKFEIKKAESHVEVLISGDAQPADWLAKKSHDLKGAIRSLGLAVEQIEEGYRFDDNKAQNKIEAIRKSFNIVKLQIEILNEIYEKLQKT